MRHCKEGENDDDLLQHASRLLEYPDSPYTEEVLLMRGEVLFNRQQYPQALADYKQLQAKATTAEHRQLGLLGALRCGTLMHDDAETIHAATALLAEGKLSPERRDEALYDRAKAYLSQKAGAKAPCRPGAADQGHPHPLRSRSQIPHRQPTV